jgi:hypothetical protein
MTTIAQDNQRRGAHDFQKKSHYPITLSDAHRPRAAPWC